MQTTALGIDLGSSTWVVAAVDRHGGPIDSVERPAPFDADGRIDASRVLQAVDELVLTLDADVLAGCASIGIAGMAEPSLGWHAGRVVGRATTWLAPIGSSAGHDAATARSRPGLVDRTGVPAGPVAAVPHIRSLLQNRTDVDQVVSLPDAVAAAWTGVAGTVPSIATRSGIFDRRRRVWDHELAMLEEIRAEALPPISPEIALRGLSPAIAERLGVGDRTTVAAVGHDHPVAADLASGRSSGRWVLSMGTAEVLMVVLDDAEADRIRLDDNGSVAIGPHVRPGQSYAGTAVGMTGQRLAEAAGQVGGHDALRQLLEERAEQVDGLVAELVADAGAAVDRLVSTLGRRPDWITAVGPASRHHGLLAARSEALGVTVSASPIIQATAVSAARLALDAHC